MGPRSSNRTTKASRVAIENAAIAAEAAAAAIVDAVLPPIVDPMTDIVDNILPTIEGASQPEVDPAEDIDTDNDDTLEWPKSTSPNRIESSQIEPLSTQFTQRSVSLLPATLRGSIASIASTPSTLGVPKTRKEQYRWSPQSTHVLLTVLADEANEGRKADNSFKRVSFEKVCDKLNSLGLGRPSWEAVSNKKDRVSYQSTSSVLLFNTDQLRKNWDAWVKLTTEASGLGYNPTNGRVTCDREVWNQYIKSNKDAAQFRDKLLDDERAYELIYTGTSATGGGSRAIPRTEAAGIASEAIDPQLFDEGSGYIRTPTPKRRVVSSSDMDTSGSSSNLAIKRAKNQGVLELSTELDRILEKRRDADRLQVSEALLLLKEEHDIDYRSPGYWKIFKYFTDRIIQAQLFNTMSKEVRVEYIEQLVSGYFDGT